MFVLRIEGSKPALELPGIVDEVVTLAEIKADDGSAYRAFVTPHTVNPTGLSAKSRPQRSPTTCWSRRPSRRASTDRWRGRIRATGCAGSPAAHQPPHKIIESAGVIAMTTNEDQFWNDFNDAERSNPASI